jgi:hypothetical protein
VVECGDFFDRPPALFDAVVGNPPYVRQELLGAERKRRLRISGRADLSVAFVQAALDFVKPGRRAVLVLSSAILDAAYAAGALGGILHTVVGSPRERWFADAAVNAVILVLQHETSEPIVARLAMPVAEAAAKLRSLDYLDEVAELRRGRDPAELLRAPREWLDAERQLPLVPLGEIAEIRRGCTSGANEFFYLSRERARSFGIEPQHLAPLL